jgi:hypothetical protein
MMIHIAPGSASSMKWYAGRNGESFGPFAFERLIEGAQSGELQRTDLVWRTGMDAWVSASTIPELWQQKKGREPIFLVPPVLWIPFLVFVGVNAGLLMFSGAQHTYLVRVLGFIPARYGGLSAQLPGGEITVWTSPIHLFLDCRIRIGFHHVVPTDFRLCNVLIAALG